MPLTSTRIAARPCGRCRSTAVLFLSALALATAPAAVTMPQAVAAERSVAAHQFADHIAEASLRSGIPAHWIVAVLRAESAGDVRAISSAGAMGLMQVMPGTWAELRTRHRLGGDPYHPRDNILAGAAYLREMFDRYGNVAAMLAAYNAGPGRYDEYLAAGRPLPVETRAYVALLAPALGVEAPSMAASVALPPPPDWRESPLFGARVINRQPAEVAQPNRPSADRQSPATSTTHPADGLRSDSLYVARGGGGDRR